MRDEKVTQIYHETTVIPSTSAYQEKEPANVFRKHANDALLILFGEGGGRGKNRS